MNTHRHFFLLLSLSATMLSCGSRQPAGQEPDNTLHIQWNDEKQTIDGFGTAQAGWADMLFAHHKREEVMQLMFGQDGLRLNILRGEVFPHYWDSPTDTDFNLTDPIDLPLTDPIVTEKSDDRLRRGQLWITKEAKEKYQVDKLFFSVWSAPAFMKSNGKVSQGELKQEYYQAFADYLAAFYRAYSSVGLEPYAISPSNEPGYAAEWNSSVWTAANMGRFITSNLGPTFRKEQIPAHIVFGENPFWSAVNQQVECVSSLAFVSTILNQYPEITEYPVIAAGHGYTLPDSYPAPKDSLLTPVVPFETAEKKGVHVWLTEISNTAPLDTTIQDGVKWAAIYHNYLATANASAFIWWAGALPAGNNEGLIVLEPDRLHYTMTKRFYTLGNFSRYIPANSKRVAANLQTATDSLLVSAYKHADEFTIVAVNTSSRATCTLLQADGQQPAGALNRYLTDQAGNWQPLAVEPDKQGRFLLEVPAGSVATFTGKIK